MSDLERMLGLAGITQLNEFDWDEEESYDSMERRIQSGGGQTTNFNIDRSKPKNKMTYGGKTYTVYATPEEIKDFMAGEYSKGWELAEPQGATTQAAPKPAEPSKMTPLNGPATTQAAPDNRNTSELEPLAAEPTKTDKENDTIAGFDAQADADADLSTTASTNNAARDGDRQADADAGLSDLARTNSTVADFDTAFSKDDGLGQMARANNAKRDTANRVADFDRQADVDDDLADLIKRANPQASVDTDRGTSHNKMRDTISRMSQADTIADLDKQFDADEYDFDTRLGGTDVQRGEVNDLLDKAFDKNNPMPQDLDSQISQSKAKVSDLDQQIADLEQAMMQDQGMDYAQPADTGTAANADQGKPASFKDVYKQADLDRPMPNSVKSGEDLYKAIDDYLNGSTSETDPTDYR